MQEFRNFKEFYPFYLEQHQDPSNRVLHCIGSTLVLLVLAAAIVTGHWLWLVAMPVVGYGFAWVGHFFFEKNKPATFTYPLWSLMGDWVMYWQIVTAQLSIR